MSIVIGIIGAGRVGATLGRRFRDAGHTVVHGVRSPEDPKHAALITERVHVDTIASAVARADVALLATPWSAAQAALSSVNGFDGKVLIDATNPVGPGMVLTHGTTDSGGEQVARWATSARVVKAFNCVGMEVMANPQFGDSRSVLFLCGDDASACSTVAQLAVDIGFEPLTLGPLSRARFVEPAALVWITAAATIGTREFSWGVLRRS
ncbi:MAG: NAD(P)-binding domain-containing protein [Gemmatimonadaceae bacterium]|nr:NAD(P)-binding domain-containing protein [Gemmatimonadaceae bacterium]